MAVHTPSATQALRMEEGGIPVKPSGGCCAWASWSMKKKLLVSVGSIIGMIGVAVSAFLIYQDLSKS